jgi:heat shock protein beta
LYFFLADCFQALSEFDGHKLQSLTKEGAKFGDEDETTIKKRAKAYKETFKPLTKFLKNLLGTKVSKVLVSQRVEKSPSVIVTSQYGNTANMERIMRAQTFASSDHIKAMSAAKTLELNPRHPIVIELNSLVTSAPDEQATKDLGHLLFDTALLASGFQQDDLEGYSERMIRTLAKTLNLDSLDLAPEVSVEEEEAKEEEVKEEAETKPASENVHDEF